MHVSAFLTPSIQHFARLVHDALKCDSGVSKKRKPCQHSVILVSISLDFCSTLVCQCRHTIPLTFETPKACIQYLEIICVGILKLIGWGLPPGVKWSISNSCVCYCSPHTIVCLFCSNWRWDWCLTHHSPAHQGWVYFSIPTFLLVCVQILFHS